MEFIHEYDDENWHIMDIYKDRCLKMRNMVYDNIFIELVE